MNIWQKITKGAQDGTQAFCGPHTAQIDLTDRCNNRCIACWVHSPLLDKKEIFPKGERELSYNLVERLILELHKSGTKEITLSGSGEPFLYPQIKKVIKLIKDLGIYLNIITNGILINEEMADYLIDQEVDLITASMWAGTPEIYLQTHPGKDVKDFEIIRENFIRLAKFKEQRNSPLPYVKIYNVLCSKNYNNVDAMIDFARDVDASFIEFQVVDIVKGGTDALLLDNIMKAKIVECFERIEGRLDFVKWRYHPSGKADEENIIYDYGKIWKNQKSNFFLFERAYNLVCPEGRLCKKGEHTNVLIPPGHLQQPRFRFFFDKEECNICKNFTECFPSQECFIDTKLLSFLGIETFTKRVSSPEAEWGIYENDINSIPCYIGWYYVRVLTNGDVIPCCKANLHPLGNLYKKSFSKIWNSRIYNRFRFMAKKISKNDPYFSKINCIKSCDNWGMNLEIHKRVGGVSVDKAETTKAETKKEVVVLAKDFIKGNFNAGYHDFGKDLIIDGGEKGGFAHYTLSIYGDGLYEMWSRYASNDIRPVAIYLNKQLVKERGLNGTTGGWTTRFLKWYKELSIELKKGKILFEIHSSNSIPHIEKFVFFKKDTPPSYIKKEENISIFKNIYQRIYKKGLNEIVSKAVRYFTPQSLKNRYLDILGLYDGENSYKGPFHVQIDLTNNCNNTCIACWCNSPLLKERRLSPEEKKQYLPLTLVKEILDEISSKGATEVYYSGSGEPFIHPQIMEVLEYTKRKNLICHVNTNFTLLNKEKLDCLMDIGVDFLTVSTWAATPLTYAKTHPNLTEEDFYTIRENLIYLNTHKRDGPCIKLYNVLFNMNYFEAEKMVEFAAETKSESLEFTLIDTVPNATDILALNREQLGELKEALARIKYTLDKNNRVKNSDVLIFQFDQFLRRIYVDEDVQEARYDRNIIDNMPCYIGWLFARVIPNGEVHSCLKAHRIPTGSLYLNRFLEIWDSPKQVNFRKKTLTCRKDDPFFWLIGNDANIKEAGCYKSCDDIGRNSWMHDRIRHLTGPERLALKGIAKTLKIVKKIRPKKEGYKKCHEDPVVAGIFHGRKAFLGPEQVVIDPTNKCNLKCTSCWLYSPLLAKDKPSHDLLNKELSKDALIKLIDELSLLGTRRIRFTGGGEPFMHKDLMEVIERAREKQLLVAITTNFGLVSRRDIKRLIDLDLEELCISIWASNPETYKRVHHGVSPIYFEKLKDNLIYLKEIKKRRTRVTFANVIMNSNFKGFNDMYEFGLRYSADAIYYTLVDVFKGQTDQFLLNEEERKELLASALHIKERNKNDNVQLEFFDGFLRRLSKSKEDFERGEYDRCDINRIPCYVGWIFSRILADGSVVPCCRGVKKVIGNINTESFNNIWRSEKYNEFRSKAKFLSKDNPYFREIGCTKECDNLMHNEEIHRRLVYNK